MKKSGVQDLMNIWRAVASRHGRCNLLPGVGSGFRALGFGLRDEGLFFSFRFWGLMFWVSGFEFRVSSFEIAYKKDLRLSGFDSGSGVGEWDLPATGHGQCEPCAHTALR